TPECNRGGPPTHWLAPEQLTIQMHEALCSQETRAHRHGPRDSHRDPGIESHRGVQTGPPRLCRICWRLVRLSRFSADTQSRPKSVGRPTSVNSIPCRTRVPTTADPRQLPWPVRAEFLSSDTRQNSFCCPATVRLLSGKFQSLPMTPN